MQYYIISILFSFMSLSRYTDKPKKVLFFGDSITELGVNDGGYISLLNEMLASKGLKDNYELVGSGVGGNKVYDLFFRMERDVLAQHPDVVVIWIGVNDVWHKSTFGTGTDLNKFELAYAGIIQQLLQRQIRVICCTPACIGEKTDFSNQQDGDLNEYSKSIRRTAAAYKVELIDFRRAFLEYNLKHNRDNLAQGILTDDGVHLNGAGNRLVAEMMLSALLEH